MSKITRVRTGCWTCKKRRRKCDEAKPACNNCLDTGRTCEGYGLKLSFDVDDSRNVRLKTNAKGEMIHGFRGRPRLKESLAKRAEIEEQNVEMTKVSINSQVITKDPTINQMPVFASLDTTGNSFKVKDLSVNQVQDSQPDKKNKTQLQNKERLVSFHNSTGNTHPVSTAAEIGEAKRNHEKHNLGTNLSMVASSQPLQAIKLQPTSSFLEEFTMFQDLFPELAYDQDFAPLIDFTSFEKQFPPDHLTVSEQIDLPSGETNHLNNGHGRGQDRSVVDHPAPGSISKDLLNDENNQIPYIEENMMLKHFFKKLLPLLDAHPSTPWPQLALKYCDFEIAKSCFLALSCLHLYEQKGRKEEFYKVGMVHINKTMEYLIDYLKDKSDETSPNTDHPHGNNVGGDEVLVVSTIIKNLKKQPLAKQRSNFFVILLLIHVHSLFSVVESGRSALARTFMELFGEIVKIPSFNEIIEMINDDSVRFLIANLSWFDTISAVISPDCRLPFCEEGWYGDKNSVGSTTKLMGCPGEIFVCISRFCDIRRSIKYGINLEKIEEKFQDIKSRLLNYREYITLEINDSLKDYEMKIYCAQCWMLAVLINLYRLVKPIELKNELTGLIGEFVFTYSKIPPTSPLVTQMVWPLFTVSAIAERKDHRSLLFEFAENLAKNGQTGTCHTILSVVKECWETGLQWEQVLSGKEWFESGIEFLVV